MRSDNSVAEDRHPAQRQVDERGHEQHAGAEDVEHEKVLAAGHREVFTQPDSGFERKTMA